jgi:hypothetical protein
MILGKLNIPLVGSFLKNNLISCWEFEETSGTTMYDSHNSNNGTINGSTVNQTGKLSKCYSFDGTNDLVTTPLTSTYSQFTVSFWMAHNFSASVGYDRILGHSKSTSKYHDWGIQQEGTINKISFYVMNTTGDFSKAISTTSLTSNTWYHVTTTFDGTYAKIYVNSTNEHTGSAFLGSRNSHTSPILLGKVYDSSRWLSSVYNGKLDQTAIWDRVLTASEIEQLYNSGNGLAYTSW